MPQTAGVLRFSQFLKNRTLTQQSSVATPTPPASQRKRVAAIQVEKSASVRPPIPPSQSITKGTVALSSPIVVESGLLEFISRSCCPLLFPVY